MEKKCPPLQLKRYSNGNVYNVSNVCLIDGGKLGFYYVYFYEKEGAFCKMSVM